MVVRCGQCGYVLPLAGTWVAMYYLNGAGMTLRRGQGGYVLPLAGTWVAMYYLSGARMAVEAFAEQ